MRDVFEPSILPVSGRNMQDPRWRTSRRKVGYEMESIVFVKILIFEQRFIVSIAVSLKKRPPQRPKKRKIDVFVNRKTDFKGQLERCQKLLDCG